MLTGIIRNFIMHINYMMKRTTTPGLHIRSLHLRSLSSSTVYVQSVLKLDKGDGRPRPQLFSPNDCHVNVLHDCKST